MGVPVWTSDMKPFSGKDVMTYHYNMTTYYGLNCSQVIIPSGDICENVFVWMGLQKVEIVTWRQCAIHFFCHTSS